MSRVLQEAVRLYADWRDRTPDGPPLLVRLVLRNGRETLLQGLAAHSVDGPTLTIVSEDGSLPLVIIEASELVAIEVLPVEPELPPFGFASKN